MGWRRWISGWNGSEEASQHLLGGVGVAEEGATAFLSVWEV